MVEPLTRILLCEDDENLGVLLKEYLIAKGYDVELYPDGELGYKAFAKRGFDLCLLDIMMPKRDGLTLAQDIRNLSSTVPIIFLTAKNLKEDILEGFKVGADDYITKPFSMEELLFRIEAILRRSNSKKEKVEVVYQMGRFVFDSQNKTLTIDGKVIELTNRETDLLFLLARNANNTVERSYALKTIWADDSYFTARSMDVYITKLRRRLVDDPNVRLLNVHGKGYKLVYPGADAQD